MAVAHQRLEAREREACLTMRLARQHRMPHGTDGVSVLIATGHFRGRFLEVAPPRAEASFTHHDDVECVVVGALRGPTQARIVTVPAVPSTRTRVPFCSRLRLSLTDITAGIFISRAVTAPWESGPPLSVTTATAL